jgi:hypothetical protein
LDELGLQEISPIAGPVPRIHDDELAMLIAAGRRIAAQLFSPRDPSAEAGEPLATALVWVKYAYVRLQFTIGDESTVLAFDGWAQSLSAPPFVCPHSGVQTYHIGATDDGRIVAAEQIATCARSARRVLRGELVECCVTGERVLAEYTSTCPVLGKPVQTEFLVACAQCHEQVSRAAISGDRCEACRNLRRLDREDPRLEWIVSAHPELLSWKRFRLAETHSVYVVEAANLWRRLLLVVDRNDLKVRHAATATCLSRGWTTVPGSGVLNGGS